MSILKYRALLTTIECGSQTKAAQVLNYTQPGISHMIQSLEEEFGFPLVNRTKDGILPTPEFNQIKPVLVSILNDTERLNETVDQIKGLFTGLVRVGSFYSIAVSWLPQILKTFSSNYPDIEIQIMEADEGELTSDLLNASVDFALMSAPAPEGFEFYCLRKDPIMAVLPENHPLASLPAVDPAELMKYPFIVPYEGSDEDNLRVFNGEKMHPDIKYRIKGDETIIHMVAQGLGVALFPELLLNRLPEGVVKRPLTKPYNRELGIGIRSLTNAAPATTCFIHEIYSHIAPELL